MSSRKESQEHLVMSVPEAGALLGLSPRAAYRAAERWLATGGREGLPCLRLGERRLLVSKARLLEWLGAANSRAGLISPESPMSGSLDDASEGVRGELRTVHAGSVSDRAFRARNQQLGVAALAKQGNEG